MLIAFSQKQWLNERAQSYVTRALPVLLLFACLWHSAAEACSTLEITV
jgi:hypothetical protein